MTTTTYQDNEGAVEIIKRSEDRSNAYVLLRQAQGECALACLDDSVEVRIANAVAWHLLDDAIAYLNGHKVKGVRYLPSEIVAEA